MSSLSLKIPWQLYALAETLTVQCIQSDPANTRALAYSHAHMFSAGSLLEDTDQMGHCFFKASAYLLFDSRADKIKKP